ncbi:MAG: D-TA family PLP-dependent enzyme [Isosphaeraceae bacterium]
MDPWSAITRQSQFLSPSLVIDRGLVRKNLEAMVAMAGGPDRLRPHVKTHKMPAIVKMTEALGVHKHKVATIAEAEMVAAAGGRDVLFAFPVVGPTVDRLRTLIEKFPETTFRAVVDDPDATRALSQGMAGTARAIPVLVDIEIGMGRTGIDPGDPAFELYRLVDQLPNLVVDGIHAYDGHIQDSDLDQRIAHAREGTERTLALRDRLLAAGFDVPRLVMGGTPTFPVHARLEVPGVECSPGTCTLQDDGYSRKLPDLPFTPAAVLFSRVISRPRPGRITLDLGHKAVAADPAGPRVRLLDVPDPKYVVHSEEHLVVETPGADQYPPGTVVLAIPTHICPTCALHRRVYVVENGVPVDEWEVAARDRVLSC